MSWEAFCSFLSEMPKPASCPTWCLPERHAAGGTQRCLNSSQCCSTSQNSPQTARLLKPCWMHQLLEELSARKTLITPKKLRDKFGKELKVRTLKPRAKALLKFLEKVRTAHFANSSGEEWLYMATFLDPRFKGMGCLSARRRPASLFSRWPCLQRSSTLTCKRRSANWIALLLSWQNKAPKKKKRRVAKQPVDPARVSSLLRKPLESLGLI